jgi:hypothetical protein
MTTKITPRSLEIFLAYARDTENWSNEVPWNGNVRSTEADKGNLTQLKRAGLVTTRVDHDPNHYIDNDKRAPPQVWLEFTDAGIALAAEHGIEI